MNNLRRLGLSIALVCTLAMVAFADEPPSCDPGETHGPPCSTAQVTPDDSAVQSEVIPPASNTGSDYSVTVLAVDVVESLLLIF
jgi:hypothetical protein